MSRPEVIIFSMGFDANRTLHIVTRRSPLKKFDFRSQRDTCLNQPQAIQMEVVGYGAYDNEARAGVHMSFEMRASV